MEKWDVNGVTCLGLFSVTSIPADTELTFEYSGNGDSSSERLEECLCKSSNCRGYIFPPVKSKRQHALCFDEWNYDHAQTVMSAEDKIHALLFDPV